MTTGLYVFGEYIKRLQTLFQQNKVNVSFMEIVRLIAKGDHKAARQYNMARTNTK